MVTRPGWLRKSMRRPEVDNYTRQLREQCHGGVDTEYEQHLLHDSRTIRGDSIWYKMPTKKQPRQKGKSRAIQNR